MTRPESDGAAGPITSGSGSRGGGAEAGRGQRREWSLREAQPRRGPAGGWEVAGPGGARRVSVAAGRVARPAAEAKGGRRRAGPGVGELIPLRPRARVPGAVGLELLGEAPGLMRDLPAVPSDLRLAVRGLPGGGPRKTGSCRELPDCYDVRLFSSYPPFTQGRDSPSAR